MDDSRAPNETSDRSLIDKSACGKRPTRLLHHLSALTVLLNQCAPLNPQEELDYIAIHHHRLDDQNHDTVQQVGVPLITLLILTVSTRYVRCLVVHAAALVLNCVLATFVLGTFDVGARRNSPVENAQAR